MISLPITDIPFRLLDLDFDWMYLCEHQMFCVLRLFLLVSVFISHSVSQEAAFFFFFTIALSQLSRNFPFCTYLIDSSGHANRWPGISDIFRHFVFPILMHNDSDVVRVSFGS